MQKTKRRSEVSDPGVSPVACGPRCTQVLGTRLGSSLPDPDPDSDPDPGHKVVPATVISITSCPVPNDKFLICTQLQNNYKKYKERWPRPCFSVQAWESSYSVQPDLFTKWVLSVRDDGKAENVHSVPATGSQPHPLEFPKGSSEFIFSSLLLELSL